MRSRARVWAVVGLAVLSLPIVGHAQVTPGTTTRVSLDSTGNQGKFISYEPSISADGRYVAFESSADNLVTGHTIGSSDVFVRDLLGVGSSSATPIPNLGQWGLILGGLGVFARRQQHRSIDASPSSQG